MSVKADVPAVPPLASVHVKSCVLSPGGLGGVIGGAEINGPVLPFVAGPCEVAAVGAGEVLHATSTTASAVRAAARTGE